MDLKQFYANHKTFVTTAFAVLSVIVFFHYFLIAPLISLSFLIKELPDRVDPLKATITGTMSNSNVAKDLEFLVVELDYFKMYVTEVKDNVHKMSIFSYVPVVGSYISDATILTESASEMIDISTGLISSIETTIPKLSFGGWGAITDAPESIEGLKELSTTLSEELPKYKYRLGQVSYNLSKIDTTKYPQELKGHPIKQYLDDLKSLSLFSFKSFDTFVDAVKLLPEFTGDGEAKNYLVFLQNDKLLKPDGAELVAYAVFRVSNGNMKIVKSGDVYLLDPTLANTSLLPDYKTAAPKIIDLWSSVPGSYPINGVVTLDMHVISSLVDVIGTIKTSEFGVLNSTTVVDKILSFSDVAGGTSPEDKKSKGAVSALLFDLLGKSFSADLQQRFTLVKTLWSELQNSHIRFYFTNQELQRLVDTYTVAVQYVENFN